MTGLEPTPHEVVQAIAWARSRVERAGFVVCDEIDSEIGYTIAQCYAMFASRHIPRPFNQFAARAAYNSALRFLVRRAAYREAYKLLGWLDVCVEDRPAIPYRRSLRNLISVLPDNLCQVAKEAWLKRRTQNEIAREFSLSPREVSRALESAAKEIIRKGTT